MKRNDKMNEVLRITDVCENGMYEQFDPEKGYTFGDFLSPSEQRRVFRCMFGHDIQLSVVDGELAFWSKTLQYAPKLNFALRDTEAILYDMNGELVNPLCIPLDPYCTDQVKRDFHCSTVVYAARGKFVSTGHRFSRTFYIDTSNSRDASHLLLATKWGGANDTTLGISEAEAEEKGKIYFEKVVSNGGQEGVDYIILPFEKYPRLGQEIRFFFKTMAREAKMFHKKCQLYTNLLKRIEQIEEDNWQLLDEAIALDEECLAQPVAKLLFVNTPKGVNTEALKMPTISFDMEEKEMGRIVLQAETNIADVRLELAIKRVSVATWKEFAPKFASIQPQAIKNYGWLSIRGDHAILTLPSKEKDKKYDSSVYAFSAQRLNDLIEDLDQYELAELEANKQNQSRLANQPSVEELLRRQADEIEARKAAMHRSEAKNPSVNPRVDRNDESSGDSDNKALEIPTLEIELK